MKFITNLFSRRNAQNLKITKLNDDWVVMRDYSIIYVGSKELCKAYVASLLVVA